MPKVLVAYENPRSKRLKGFSYRDHVVEAVGRMCGCAENATETVDKDADYVERARAAGIPAETTAAVIYHKHAGQEVIAAESGASCPPPTAQPPAAGGIGCGPFTRLVQDDAKLNECRKHATELGSLTTPRAMAKFFEPDLARLAEEVFVVVGLDVNAMVMTYTEVARGQVDHVAVAPQDVLGPVVAGKCKAFVVAHNHPSGDAHPSKDDGVLTTRIWDAAKVFPGLVPVDHIILGHGEFYSFKEKKVAKL